MKWAYYQLLTQDINGMDSGSAIPSTSRDAFYHLPVRVPPLPEQRAIAHILGTLDDKIELNRRTNRTLEDIARALFTSWFVTFDPVRANAAGRQPAGMDAATAALFPDSFETLDGLPSAWQLSTLGQEFDLTMGQSPPGSTYNELREGLPFFQGRTDFGFRYPRPRIFCTAPTRYANAGDTLVSVRAPVGSLNMALERCSVGRGVAAVRHKLKSRSYTYYMLNHLAPVLETFEAEGTVFGSINRLSFSKLSVIAPPLVVIEAFERLVSPIDSQIKVNEMQSQSLSAIRDALLPRLLSGELRVPDAERLISQGTT